MSKGRALHLIPRSAVAWFFLSMTEPQFLKLGKQIEKFRGKVPDEILNEIHVAIILSRQEEVASILG